MNIVQVQDPPRSRPSPSPYTLAQQYKAKQQLSEVIAGTGQVLVTATTVFPFTLFPDTVTLDREKLTVTHRVFFGVAEVVSIQVEDILNVTADVGPFFGSFKILTRFFDPDKPYTVNYLWRSDALKIKRIVQGYITATQRKINCSAVPPQDLSVMLEKLGAGE